MMDKQKTGNILTTAWIPPHVCLDHLGHKDSCHGQNCLVDHAVTSLGACLPMHTIVGQLKQANAREKKE